MNHLTNRLKSLKRRRRDMKKRRGEEGFTLIELMVVVLIMGILAAIAIPTFLGAKTGAQDSAVTSNLRNLLTDEATAYADTGAYVNQSSTTTLSSLDPTYAKDLTAGTIAVDVAASGTHPDWVCMYEAAPNGTYFGIGSVSSGTDAGTYYYTGTAAPTCTEEYMTTTSRLDASNTAYVSTGWTPTAKTAGF